MIIEGPNESTTRPGHERRRRGSSENIPVEVVKQRPEEEKKKR